MFRAYRRYADFTGRSNRSEYWFFVLGLLLIVVGLSAVRVILEVLLGISDPSSMNSDSQWCSSAAPFQALRCSSGDCTTSIEARGGGCSASSPC